MVACDPLNGDTIYGGSFLKTAFFFSVALLCPLSAWAADDIRPFDAKPGLWETTSTMEMQGMPAMPAMPQIPPEQLAKMSPQQRAQVEAMMKAGAGAGAPRTTTSKSCLTKESLKQALTMSQNENCTHKVIASSSSMQTIHMECTQGKVTSGGDLMIERIDAEHARGNMAMKSAGGDQAVNMKMTFTTKWISSDCGDVKPFSSK
jgi:hypothetical protein